MIAGNGWLFSSESLVYDFRTENNPATIFFLFRISEVQQLAGSS
jgi:hypothetical protein